MTEALSPDQAFAGVEKFVHSLVWQFHRRTGLPADELRSEAFMGYVQAVESYDGRTKFITWVGEKVKFALRSYVREVATTRRSSDKGLDAAEAKPRPTFDLDDLLARLSDDGKELVRLVFDTPVPVLSELVELGDTTANFRYAVRTWLQDCGWAVQRVGAAFAEVRGAL